MCLYLSIFTMTKTREKCKFLSLISLKNQQNFNVSFYAFCTGFSYSDKVYSKINLPNYLCMRFHGIFNYKKNINKEKRVAILLPSK